MHAGGQGFESPSLHQFPFRPLSLPPRGPRLDQLEPPVNRRYISEERLQLFTILIELGEECSSCTAYITQGRLLLRECI